MNTFNLVYDIVAKIPKGKVTTYGALARQVGINPRVVGFALHVNQNPDRVPCHRVVNAKGMISSGFAFGGPDGQKRLLLKEGVKLDANGVIDLNKYGYFLF